MNKINILKKFLKINVVFLLFIQLLSSNIVKAEDDLTLFIKSPLKLVVKKVTVKKSDLTSVLYNYVPPHHVLLHNGEIILKNFIIGKRFNNHDALVSVLEDNQEEKSRWLKITSDPGFEQRIQRYVNMNKMTALRISDIEVFRFEDRTRGFRKIALKLGLKDNCILDGSIIDSSVIIEKSEEIPTVIGKNQLKCLLHHYL